MARAKKSWYAVLRGRQPGLYRTWDRCKAQVDRYPGATYMGFFSREEAAKWIRRNGDDASGTDDEESTVSGTQIATRTIDEFSSPPPPSSSSINDLIADYDPGWPAYYAVARGRQPGLYRTWEECQVRVEGFSGARYKKFKAFKEAVEFLAVYGGGGHFSQFISQGFKPDQTASFSEEWARLSQSQHWRRGTKHYCEQRASALRNELQTHFFASSSRALPAIKQEVSEEESADVVTLIEPDPEHHEAAVELHGFQSMCKAVGKSPAHTVEGCKKILKQTLVNIVDLIDARRAGRTLVKTWTDFDAFKRYTLNYSGRDKTIPWRVAEKDPLLKCFLQNFSKPRGHGNGLIGGGGAVVRKRARSPGENASEYRAVVKYRGISLEEIASEDRAVVERRATSLEENASEDRPVVEKRATSLEDNASEDYTVVEKRAKSPEDIDSEDCVVVMERARSPQNNASEDCIVVKKKAISPEDKGSEDRGCQNKRMRTLDSWLIRY